LGGYFWRKEMIKVLFLVHRFFDTFNKEFGGTTREFSAMIDAFKDDKEFELIINKDFAKEFDSDKFKEYIRGFDIIHCEDIGTLKSMLKHGFYPDIIGPTIKSPTKSEEMKNKWILEGLSVEDYYKPVVIRNNHSEERLDGYWNKIKFIQLGVDTKKIIPINKSNQNYILWAGDVTREAKNFQMFMDIMKITSLPEPYKFKVLSGYKLSDYLELLDNCAMVINTSKQETFCFAMFEANSKGVPTIYRKGLHNPMNHPFIKLFHKDKPIQVGYSPEEYRDKILELLSDKERLKDERKIAREYVIKNASLKNLRNSVGKVYKEIYNSKYHKV
jgi:glycosyltransferase involved in cell wall biosynthesis